MKYKAGDKVRCISREFTMYIQVGDVYTVKRVKGNRLVFEEIELPHSYVDSRFVLVESKPKFKVNDKIRCVDNSNYHNQLTVGKVYTVVSEDVDQRYVRIIPDHYSGTGGYRVERFELVQEGAVLAPEEVFEHLRKGTQLQIRNRCITPRDITYNWVDIGEDFMEDLLYETICSETFRIKPEPEVIELNGKKYREITD